MSQKAMTDKNAKAASAEGTEPLREIDNRIVEAVWNEIGPRYNAWPDTGRRVPWDYQTQHPYAYETCKKAAASAISAYLASQPEQPAPAAVGEGAEPVEAWSDEETMQYGDLQAPWGQPSPDVAALQAREATLEQALVEANALTKDAFKAGWYTNAAMDQPADYLKGADEADWLEYNKAESLDAYLNSLLKSFVEAREEAADDFAALQTRAAKDVLAERQRQVTAEGWKAEHDDEYLKDELARAAAAYAHPSPDMNNGWQVEGYDGAYRPVGRPIPKDWPWHPTWWKPSDRRRNLVKAGALILAEIERLDRMEGK